MPEWLQSAVPDDPVGPWWGVLLRLIAGFALGGTVAGIYRYTRRGATIPPSFPSTLVLLSILVAMVTHVIGDHVARAFSLVGALSIVRFRTVVEDTYDIVFVIFAVVIGMAIGAGNWMVAFVGTIVTGLAATVVSAPGKPDSWADKLATLSVRIGIGHNPDSTLQTTFAKHLQSHRLITAESGRQGAALDFVYQVRLRPGSVPTEMIAELNRLDGIQRVELRRD